MPFAKLGELKHGSVVALDDRFPCATSNKITILEDTGGLYFECIRGNHYIAGELDKHNVYAGIKLIDCDRDDLIPQTVTVDLPPVTEDEAVTLCLHHLAMAASYFEATPNDNNSQIFEELYLLSGRSVLGMKSPFALASRAFLFALLSYFENEERRDG